MSDDLPILDVKPLTREAFAPFGDVIHVDLAETVFTINGGTAHRYHDLARIDTDSENGKTIVSLFRAQPRTLPIVTTLLERHPLGSQAFMPLGPNPYLVVVGNTPDGAPSAFLAQPDQGINLNRGVWHHPMLALDRVSDFLVIDRGGKGHNLDEVPMQQRYRIVSLQS